MSNYRPAIKLSELPDTEPRKSIYELDQLITKLSGIQIRQIEQGPILEMILCLANEIKELKEKVK